MPFGNNNGEIFRVSVIRGPSVDAVLKKLSKVSPKSKISSTVSRRFTALQVKLTKDLTEIAEAAVKSTIPIHNREGGTLRDRHVRSNISSIKPSKMTGEVFIDSEVHRPPYNFNGSADHPRPDASSLAEILETNDEYTRTRPSEAEAGFTAVSGGTAGWIEEAHKQFRTVSRRYLNSKHDIDFFLRGS